MKKFVTIIFLFAFFVQANAQEEWSLQTCIDYALENNIVIKQYKINTEYRENQLDQSKNNRLPDLDANISQGFNFGRSLTINNTYENYRSANTGFSANSSILIYRGSTLKNTIKQREFEMKSGLEELEKAKDDITVNIASGYLDILFAKELEKVALKQIEQTKQQIERTKQLVDAGKLAKGTLLEIEAQLAREKLNLVNRQNNLQLAYLNLVQLLELDDYNDFNVVVPELPLIKAEASVAGVEKVFDRAVKARPEIKSAEFNLKSSQMELKVAEGNRLPILSASAGIYDQYFTRSGVDNPGFGDQLADNHRESVGLNLRIPIFSRFQNKTAIANSKLQVLNNELELEATKKQLRKNIETAYTNAKAALNRYKANEVAVKSMEESFRYIQEKFSVGMVTTVEFNEAKTKLTIAQSDLIQAKFEFIFRSKILDFYNGIPIALD